MKGSQREVCVGSLSVGFLFTTQFMLRVRMEEGGSVDLLFGVSECWCES